MTYLARLATATAPLDGTDDIQLFPPGKHDIQPIIRKDDGSQTSRTVSVTIDRDVADAIEASRATHQADADAGKGDSPYLDFNHKDDEASARVLKIYWGGDDPVKGGVRAKIIWTGSGQRAVDGKDFRRISPGFLVDDAGSDTPRIIGAPVNMGGLVNQAAFRTIAPLFASYGGNSPFNNEDKNQTKTMTDDEINKLKAHIAELEATVDALRKEKEELETENETMAEAQADEAVAKAVEEGRIEPGEEIQAKWKKMILRNHDARELLAKQPVNPAFQAAYKASDNAQSSKSKGAYLARLAALPSEQRFEFYRKNKAEILAEAGKA